jgi:gliding motility-associated-like protein
MNGEYVDTLVAVSGCDSVRKLNLTVQPLPVGNISVVGNRNIICDGSSVVLAGSGGERYQWFLNGAAIPGATSAFLEATRPGTYSLELISPFGCKNQTTSNPVLTVLQKPTVDFSLPFGCVGTLLTFNNLSQLSSSDPVRYDWDLGGGVTTTENSPNYIYDKGGSYDVKLTVTPLLCPQLAESIVKSIVIESPRAGIRYPDVNTLMNTNTNLSARSSGDSYFWQPSAGLNNFRIMNPIFNYNKETEYTIDIRTLAGCKTVDTLRVRMFNTSDLYVPEAFTPNGDGVNDRLDVFLVGIKELVFFRVFNRWGQLMFETNNAMQRWDGKYRNTVQPLETYVWVAEAIANDGRVIKKRGQTVLIR